MSDDDMMGFRFKYTQTVTGTAMVTAESSEEAYDKFSGYLNRGSLRNPELGMDADLGIEWFNENVGVAEIESNEG